MMRVLFGFAWALSAADGAAALLDCGSPTHVAGTVAQGRPLVTEVVCQNSSGAPMELLEVATGCPCLSISPTVGDIPAGGTLRMRLTLTTDALTDRVGFPIEAQVRGRPKPVSLFHYEADVRPSVMAYPEYVDLGDWKRGEDRTVLLVDSTGTGFSIEGASSVRGTVEVRWTKVGLLRVADRWTVVTGKAAVQGWQISVHARPGLVQARRSLSDEVQLDLRHPVQKTVRFRVVGFAP